MPGEPIGKCYKCSASLYATLGLCASCELVEVQAKNKLLKDRLREFADNVLMILENDTTLDLDTKNRLEYEFKQTEQARKGE